MRRIFLLTLAALGFSFILMAYQKAAQLHEQKLISIPANKIKLIGCSPDRETLVKWIENAEIPPMPGAGTHKWMISTKNDSAQFYFNQGINMYYSFHIIEALASFRKALRFDPSSGMLHWA